MKKIKYILLAILFLSLNIFYVKASCTEEELSSLKKEAEKIKVTYKHMGAVEYEDGIDYNRFKVNIKNISNDFYVAYLADTKKIAPEKGNVTLELSNGNWNFNIYSNKCNAKIYSIKFKLPKYNIYYLDPLCNGIDSNNFPLCGKYYEYDVSYENFIARVEHYRANYKIENNNSDEITKNNLESIISNILKIINQYKLYFLIFFITILVVMAYIIISIKRKKRGVLQ